VFTVRFEQEFLLMFFVADLCACYHQTVYLQCRAGVTKIQHARVAVTAR
jgi:hypothetical protein